MKTFLRLLYPLILIFFLLYNILALTGCRTRKVNSEKSKVTLTEESKLKTNTSETLTDKSILDSLVKEINFTLEVTELFDTSGRLTERKISHSKAYKETQSKKQNDVSKEKDSSTQAKKNTEIKKEVKNKDIKTSGQSFWQIILIGLVIIAIGGVWVYRQKN